MSPSPIAPLTASLTTPLTVPLTRALDRTRRSPRGPAARLDHDTGMSTAEYALGTVAACAFAAVLYAILTSAAVRDTLTRMVTDALSIGG